MGLFKSADEKSADRARAAATKAEARARAERSKYLASPVGRAEAAYARGDRMFQLATEVEDDGGRVIQAIEAQGWRLEHAGYSHAMHISSLGNMNDQLASISSSGSLMGVYLFRRV